MIITSRIDVRINLGFPYRLPADRTIDHSDSIVAVLSIAANAESLPRNLCIDRELRTSLRIVSVCTIHTAILVQPLSDQILSSMCLVERDREEKTKS